MRKFLLCTLYMGANSQHLYKEVKCTFNSGTERRGQDGRMAGAFLTNQPHGKMASFRLSERVYVEEIREKVINQISDVLLWPVQKLT